MKLDIRYSHHPEDMKGYDTEALRRHFLVEEVFVTGELKLTYTHVDRVVFGGAVPTTQALSLEGGKMGSVNLGWSPVSVFRKATMSAFSSGVNFLPSCRRPMVSTACVSVSAAPSWK